MKKTTKALLWSALVCPGAGHFSLNRYRSGSLLMGTALLALVYLSTKALQRATLVSEQIVSGAVPLDVAVIREMIMQSPVGNEALCLNLASGLLAGCWLLALLDIYRLGRRPSS